MTSKRQYGDGAIIEYKNAKGQKLYAFKVWVPTLDGKRKQVMRRKSVEGAHFTTRRQASDGMRTFLASLDVEGYRDPTRLTVGSYMQQWLDGLRKAPQTMASYRRTVRLHVTPHLGDIPLAKLTPARVRAYHRELETKPRSDGQDGTLSSRTVQYAATLLKKGLSEAVYDGLIPTNPCDRVKTPQLSRDDQKEQQAWTASQARDFLVWLQGADVDPVKKVLFELALRTGARRGELLALRWRHVDFESGSISIGRSLGSIRSEVDGSVQLVEGPTKNGKPRTVKVHPDKLASLKALKKLRTSISFQLGTSDALVFADFDGNYLPPDSQSWTFTNVQKHYHAHLVAEAEKRELAGVDLPPRIRFHDLRHTFGTILAVEKRVDIETVKNLMGHSSIKVTEKYLHGRSAMQELAAEALAEAL